MNLSNFSRKPPAFNIEKPAGKRDSRAIGLKCLGNFPVIVAFALFLTGMATTTVRAIVANTPAELSASHEWLTQNLLSPDGPLPFSFTYNSAASSGPNLFSSWTRLDTVTNVLDANRTQYTLIWTNGSNGLQVRCVALEYLDYPMVEWTVYFKNTGSSRTPILENIQGLNLTLSRTSASEFILHGNQGDYQSPNGYAPFQITLDPSTINKFSPPSISGKSCDGPTGWPYYNLQTPGGGIILAIGWPGQWASSFTRDAVNHLQIQAGQQLTHLYMNPDEEIRTPLIAIMFWQGTNIIRSQNLWRHWYIAHEIPRTDGQLPSPFIAVAGDSTNDLTDFLRHGFKPDVLWRDADTEPYVWYPCTHGPFTGSSSWLNTGTWDVDTNYYPAGFRPVSNAIHAMGMKFLLWFEPERVGAPDSWLAKNHPEWLLPATSTTVGAILNEGNPIAFNWLTNHIENLIVANGIDWYREDMNGNGPLPAWHNNDAQDRQGVTENFYVQRHLAYWDALLAMNNGLRIDSCASGGRRNDLETMRRAVPLWRSDFAGGAKLEELGNANECLTYGLSSWLPFQGSNSGGFWDPFSMRSSYLCSFGVKYSPDPGQIKGLAECRKIAPTLLNGDYYPLTPYSLTNTVWMAWQFNWPARGTGVVQAFRRSNCYYTAATFHLNDLDADATYQVKNFDVKRVLKISGKELMENGLTITIPDLPGAAVITYQRTE